MHQELVKLKNDNQSTMRLFLLISFVVLFFCGTIPAFAQNTLFKKYEANPIIDIGSGQPDWRRIHVANAAILSPEETSDGTWRIYIRGSGNVPQYHDQIGILYQDTAGFSPYGPWLEYEHNPVIPHGSPGFYDDLHLLDCSPVVGEGGDIYFYYKAVNYARTSSLAGARSTDGGFTFEKFDSNPLKMDVGANDAVYHDGKYYIYYGDALYNRQTNRRDGDLEVYLKITEDPQDISGVDSIKVLGVGGGPGNFDSEAVNGARIFRLDGKWFMIYQGSQRHFDFPERFHAAYSDDLIHWTKVDNDFPMMTRGGLGDWDQGAIWYGEVFEHRDTLYMLYEGWGCYCIPEDRDEAYFPGNSRTGIAQVAVKDFLLWAEGGFDPSWREDPYGPGGLIADFEDHHLGLYPTHGMPYGVVTNPFPDEVNPSTTCGRVTTIAERWALLYSDPLPVRFDFSRGSVFSMKVYSSVPGNVFFKIEHPTDWSLGQLEVEGYLSQVNQWVDMEFDFAPFAPESDLYGKIILLFDAGNTEVGNHWYFDDIRFNSIATSVPPSVEQVRPRDGLRVWHDRSSHHLLVKGDGDSGDYRIFGMDGRLVQQGRGHRIYIGSLRPGVYIIRTENGGARFIR
jgi:predicted GH43/DUF377 family glycosyl hydrolase